MEPADRGSRWFLQVMVSPARATGYRHVIIRGVEVSQPRGKPSVVHSMPVMAELETRLPDNELVTSLLAGFAPQER